MSGDGDGGLAPLHWQASAAQPGADQVHAPRHGRPGVVAPAMPGHLLPAHALSPGHKLDAAVARALAAAAVLVLAPHRRRPGCHDDLRRWMTPPRSRGGAIGFAVIGAVRRHGRGHAPICQGRAGTWAASPCHDPTAVIL